MGCPANCGPPWTQAHLNAAIQRGAHPSAQTPDAATTLWSEALEKVEHGFARLVTWDSIKDNPPTNLKISSLAAIPHKSCCYWAILDLSFQICLVGLKLLSVNAATSQKHTRQPCGSWVRSYHDSSGPWQQQHQNMGPYSLQNGTSRMDSGDWWSAQKMHGNSATSYLPMITNPSN